MAWKLKAATGFAGAIALAASVILSTGVANAACQTGAIDLSAVAADTSSIAGYQGDQLVNAAAIINAAAQLHLGADAETLAVMTAMGESGLHNLDHGDTAGPDSRGLFQQRDSWGTLTQRMDPTQSALLFYARLPAVPNWQTLPPSHAAHLVQGNADPDHYTPYYAPAAAVVAGLTNLAGPGNCTPHAIGDDYPWPTMPSIDQGGGLSPLRYYYRECVDFVAWRLNRDAGVTTAPWKYTWANLTPLGGDAKDWKKNWQSHGWTVSTTPIPGSVAWWANSSSGLGHVAYVQAVHDNGTITLEEYNWTRRHVYGTRTISASNPNAYLYPPP